MRLLLLVLLLAACSHPVYVCQPALLETGQQVIACVPYTGGK